MLKTGVRSPVLVAESHFLFLWKVLLQNFDLIFEFGRGDHSPHPNDEKFENDHFPIFKKVLRKKGHFFFAGILPGR